ncbi:MAG: HlyD family efflux transporter periplasmic adaptor subunit [Flexistipes sinusarabici]|uniref:HlyD family efflux transporter periplasmic adaptor subunit n=1 Tax=Flexistipes sinusarabici TaxID=2352 RepID=A0A5D0MPA6_FLESI|nr:efflux RND transporter periplasmic adaptor subunit [Flexistipes sinusarabici]TYB33845.1 MAG: HlyD family efflux transporter periplasmic adaptor subunit [Flexistipes sinusarabici]
MGKKALLTVLILIFIVVLSAVLFDYYKQPSENILEISGRIEADEIDLGFTMPGKVEEFVKEEGDLLELNEFVARLKAEGLKAKVKRYKIEIQNAKNMLKTKKEKLTSYKLNLDKLMINKDLLTKNIERDIKIAEQNVKSSVKKLDAEKAAYEKIKFNLNKIRKDYERISNLYQKGAVSKQKYDEISSLFNITKSELEAQKALISIAENDIEKAKENLKLAKSRKDEIKALNKEIRATESSISAVKEEIKIAKNNIIKAVQAFKEVKDKLSDAIIKSPDNLVILEKYVNEGEIVAAGQPVLSSYNPENRYFRGYLPEPDLSKVKLGDTGYLKIDGLPDKKFPVKLIYISDKAEFTPKEVQTKRERVKQVFLIKMKIADEENILKPGMPADCFINLK